MSRLWPKGNLGNPVDAQGAECGPGFQGQGFPDNDYCVLCPPHLSTFLAGQTVHLVLRPQNLSILGRGFWASWNVPDVKPFSKWLFSLSLNPPSTALPGYEPWSSLTPCCPHLPHHPQPGGLGLWHCSVTAPVCTHQPALPQSWSALPRECGHVTDLWQIPEKKGYRSCMTVGPPTLSSWSGSGWTWTWGPSGEEVGLPRQQWLLVESSQYESLDHVALALFFKVYSLASRWWRRWRRNMPWWRMGGKVCVPHVALTHVQAPGEFFTAAAAAGGAMRWTVSWRASPSLQVVTIRDTPGTAALHRLHLMSSPVNGVPSTTFTVWLGTGRGTPGVAHPRKYPPLRKDLPAFLTWGGAAP